MVRLSLADTKLLRRRKSNSMPARYLQITSNFQIMHVINLKFRYQPNFALFATCIRNMWVHRNSSFDQFIIRLHIKICYPNSNKSLRIYIHSLIVLNNCIRYSQKQKIVCKLEIKRFILKDKEEHRDKKSHHEYKFA